MPPYALAPHVFACRDRDHIVLLDLRQDRYFSFTAVQTRGLAALVCGWPETGAASGAASDNIAQQLLERGFLTRAVNGSEPRLEAPAPSAEIVCDYYEDRVSNRMGYAAAFLRAAATATALLKLSSLERAVRRVRKRNAQWGSDLLDAARARELVAAFADLRPFLFTSKDACLFEALALLEFMARFDMHATWVFGVRARPFAAHCWVQHGDTVLNDTVDHVSRYTPILSV